MPSELIDDAMKRVFAKIQGEMPDVKANPPRSNQNLPMNQAARTDPLTGNVDYNPFVLQTMSPDDREQTLTHEMTHVGQRQEHPIMSVLKSFLPQGPYHQRDNEMEAFQAERNRSLSHHLSVADPESGATDIQLPPIRRNVVK